MTVEETARDCMRRPQLPKSRVLVTMIGTRKHVPPSNCAFRFPRAAASEPPNDWLARFVFILAILWVTKLAGATAVRSDLYHSYP
jgi:hypothetical protein